MSWNKIKLGDLFEQYRIEHFVQDDVEYGQITISKNGYIKYRTKKLGKTIGRKRQFIIDLTQYPNTLLFTRQGVSEGAIGFAPKEVDGCIATENMPMFALKSNFSKKFVELLLQSEQYIEKVKKLTPTGSAQKSIHERDLLKIELFIPNKEGQNQLVKQFVNIEEELSELNSEVAHQQTLLKKLRQSILQEAIEGKLTAKWRAKNPSIGTAKELLEQIKTEKEKLVKDKKIKASKPLAPINEDEIPFDIPQSWEWCKLGDIVTSYQNGISKRGGEGTPTIVLRLADIKNYKVDLSDFRTINLTSNEIDKYLLKENDILITRVNGSVDIVGNFNLITQNENKIAYCDHFIRLRLVINSIFAKYIFLLEKTSIIRDVIKQEFKTTSGQKTINQGHISNLKIPLPPIEEQKEIVATIEKLFAICDELENEINQNKITVNNLMKAVLKEAFEVEDSVEPLSQEESALSAMAYIIESFQDDKHFGRVKLQKILYMHNAVNNTDYGFDYKKHAMGPHDKERMDYLESQLKAKEWFDKIKEEGEKGQIHYPPLAKAHEYKPNLQRLEKFEALQNIIELMRPLNLRQSEVVATLYAVWQKEQNLFGTVDDELLISKAKGWHIQKGQISDKEWRWGIKWLREHQLIFNS